MRNFPKSLIKDYVSDDLVRSIFNTYIIYAPATKNDATTLNLLNSFLCRALSFHISEKLNGNPDREKLLQNIKDLDHITRNLEVKSRLYADVISRI